MTDIALSIIVPSRNEQFLKKTVEDIIKNKIAKTEIVVVLDGVWASPAVDQHPDVIVMYVPESVGQRAAGNLAVKLARGKYVMKVDAHCSFKKGFDHEMLEAFKETGDNVVMAPEMNNLHAYDWVCPKCAHVEYQDRKNICPQDGETMDMVMRWKRKRTHCTSYVFDTIPHFQYGDRSKQDGQGDIVETMSLQGSAFMCTKKNYLRLKLGDKRFGSWGSQGIQVACSFWLSGSRVLVNTRTWYAHMFRTKPDFSFPYQLSGRDIERTRKLSKAFLFENKWPKQILPSSWLIEKFKPINGNGKWVGWHDEAGKEALDMINKAGVTFTNNQKR